MLGEGFTSKPVVVLGFGAAAVSAICAMREAGYNGSLTVVTDAGPEPYSPVLTSYYAGGRIQRDQCFPWKDMRIRSMVDDLLAKAHVEGLDVDSHEVLLAGGQRIGYSKLLVATGALPVAPGFPLPQKYRPHMLRTMSDAERLRSALSRESCKRVLVSGTSMVGLKALEACLDRGCNVSLLGRSAHVLRTTAHPLVAARFERLLEERGVTLRLSRTVIRAEDREKHAGCIVHFDDGTAERFDEVILAQGVKPNLGFVREGSMEVEDGLVVDRFMRTSAPGVFAAGDVAQAFELSSGKRRVMGLWNNAVQQGRCAGVAIAAEIAGHAPTWPYPGSFPSNVVHVRDVLFASAGSISEGEGRRVDVRETQGETGLFVYEARGGVERLVGFNVLEAGAALRRRAALMDEIGLYRRTILNYYL